MVHVIGNVLIVISALECWAFVALYHLSAPWRHSEMGRHIMTFMIVFAVVLTMLAVRVIAGIGNTCGLDSPFEAAVFTAVPVVLGWRVWLLLKEQRIGSEP